MKNATVRSGPAAFRVWDSDSPAIAGNPAFLPIRIGIRRPRETGPTRVEAPGTYDYYKKIPAWDSFFLFDEAPYRHVWGCRKSQTSNVPRRETFLWRGKVRPVFETPELDAK